MECYEDFVPTSAETNTFSDYLSNPKVLSVQLDVEPFSCDGPTLSWTVIEPASQLPQQPAAAAATAGASAAHGGGTAPPTSAWSRRVDRLLPGAAPPSRRTRLLRPQAPRRPGLLPPGPQWLRTLSTSAASITAPSGQMILRTASTRLRGC